MKQLLPAQPLLGCTSYSPKNRHQPCQRNSDSPPEKVQIGSDLSAKHRQKKNDPEKEKEAETLQLRILPRQSLGQKAHDDATAIQRRDGKHIEDRQDQVQQNRLIERLHEPRGYLLWKQSHHPKECR
jgi:hypothetical protein